MAGAQSIQQGLAFDGRSLEALRRDASRDPQSAVRKAAGQFEALFMQQLMKSMRDAMPKSGMLEGPGQETYVGMLDQQLSQSLANRVGGLADMIAKQLSRHMPSPAEGANDDSADAPKGAGTATDASGIALGASAAQRPAGIAIGASGIAIGASATQNLASIAMGAPTTRKPAGMAINALLSYLPMAKAPSPALPPPFAARPASARLAQPPPSLEPEAAERLKASLSRRLDGPQAAFVDRMWPHAIAAQRSTGVAAAFVVGQAALESGWGKHEIRNADGSSSHNLFGIKATGGWKGPTVEVTTTEYVEGQPKRMVERFRAYSSYAEAFQDWASLMSASTRYGGVLREGRSVEGFAQGMQRAGYATDPKYGDKLENTINQTLLLKRLVV